MEEQKEQFRLLDMMSQPVFCVKDNRIIMSNAAARQLLLAENDEIRPLLGSGAGEYGDFSGGSLYLTLKLASGEIGACVRKWEDMDVFELDEQDSSVLQALSLASRELRKPLSAAITSTASLLEQQENPEIRMQLAGLNQGLYRMLRILGNMSDAPDSMSSSRQETTEAGSFFFQIFEKAGTLLAGRNIRLEFSGLEKPVYCLIDRDQMERAVLNILSNAAKFSPAGSTVNASLTRRGQTLRLSVQDSGSGIAQEVMGSLFRRYLRQPGIEDSRLGLGLGIQMIHRAAVRHGGTLLITPCGDSGTRVILTVAIRQNPSGTLRSPVFSLDYTGGIDHALVELADCLPAELYDGSY